MRSLCGLCVALVAVVAGAVHAGVLTDGTVGPRVRLAGDFEIGADLGTRAGGNLFHSFERFSLETGERATFSGPDEIRNVISRVTGGARSEIDGTLGSTIPGADLYFLNPAGVMFGPNASLDLQGSFHVSTADELRFADGAKFSATKPAASSFTVAAPAAFGFVGARPLAITVDSASLAVPEGRVLSLVGGDIGVSGGALTASAGEINLVALRGGAARIGVGVVTRGERADIVLRDQSRLSTTGDGGGSIYIRGGAIVVEDGTTAFADNSGPSDSQGGIGVDGGRLELRGGALLTADVVGGAGQGGAVSVRADEVEITDGSRLAGDTFAEGDGGDIILEVGRLTLTDGVVRTTAFGRGRAGDLTITAEESIEVIGENSRLFTGTGEGSPGGAGDMRLEAPRIEIAGGFVSTSTAEGSPPAAGDMVIAVDTLELTDNAHISTASLDRGPAGDLTIKAENSVAIENSRISAFSILEPAGNISISASSLEVTGNSTISAAILTPEGFAPGIAGDIAIEVESLTLSDSALIASPAILNGTAGNVFVTARDAVMISGRSGLGAESFASGRGGRIEVKARQLEIRDGGSIDTAARFEGEGGDIVIIDVESLRLASGGRITARTTGEGDAGTIDIDADRISIEGSGSRIVSSTSIAEGASEVPDRLGSAGSITIRADHLILRDGGEINSSSSREGRPGDVGDAGDITIVADRLEVDGGAITTEAQQSAGGGITLKIGDRLFLADGSRITSTISGDQAGDRAGNITIDPRFLILDDSHIVARANAGDGGIITIVADNLLRSPGSMIDASSRTGITGTVVVSTPEVDLSGGLVVLEGALLDAASQLRERCEARRDIGASSFTGVGRGGLPPTPDGPLASAYVVAEGAVGEARKTGLRPTEEAAAASNVRLAGLSAPCVPLD